MNVFFHLYLDKVKMKVNQELLFFGQEFYTSKKSQITLYHNNNKLHNNNQNLKIVTYLLFRISIIGSNSQSMATFKIKKNCQHAVVRSHKHKTVTISLF